jgi:hypothetical protein
MELDVSTYLKYLLPSLGFNRHDIYAWTAVAAAATYASIKLEQRE